MVRWSAWLKSDRWRAHRARTLRRRDRSRRSRVSVLAFGVMSPCLQQPGFVDHEVGDELQPVRVVVVHRQRERAQRDLTRAGRLVAADHVVHVVAHVVRGRVRVGAGDGDVVAPVELDVVPAERALGEVVECLELARRARDRARRGGGSGRVATGSDSVGEIDRRRSDRSPRSPVPCPRRSTCGRCRDAVRRPPVRPRTPRPAPPARRSAGGGTAPGSPATR